MKKVYQQLFWSASFILFLVGSANAQQRVVTGTITDAANSPMPGVNVLIKGTTNGTATDVNGTYSLQASENDVLVISFIGYQTREIAVSGQNSINVTLEEDLTTLAEVQVIGYGVQKKALVTGANLQVKGEELQKLSTTNALQALQGQAPGVQITSNSGQPGEGMRVIIRGLGTIGNAGPLYVVDGVLTGDISFLNPADIQSIDVLKDAASAAIYGSQAANGVVLVTTKKGKAGARAQITFDSFYGVQNVARKIGMLNAHEYAVIMNEAAVNSGNLPYFSNEEITAIRNNDFTGWNSPNLSLEQATAMGAGGTDWLDQMFVSNAPTQNYSFGATGGSENSVYSTSLSYLSQTGIVGGKDVSNYERYNFRFNSEHNLYKDVVRIGQNLNFAYIQNNGVGVGGQYDNALRGAFNASPFLPMYDAQGNFWNSTSSPWFNEEASPYAEMVLNNQNRDNNQKLLGNFYLEVEPIKNLKLRSTIGLDYNAREGRSFRPVYRLSIYSFNDTTTVDQNMGKGRTLLWDNLASYSFNLANEHNFDVMVGTSAFQYRGTWMSAGNYNMVFNDLEHAWLRNALNRSNAARMSIDGAPDADDNRLSYFGRVLYNYKETYLLNATFRADASSRFAQGNRWGYFPSISAGWVISNEAFMSNATNVINQLKLRASWGQVGNQNIRFFEYLAPVTFSKTNYAFGPNEGSLTPGAYPSRLGNPDLKWEASEQINIGLDSRLLDGKLSASIDWYNKTTRDWLLRAPILATAGAQAPFINGGDIRNTGIEAALSYSSSVGDLRYTVSANGAHNSNKATEVPTADGRIAGERNVLYNNASQFYWRAQTGYPVGYFWGFQTNGIFQTEEEVNNYRNGEGNLIQPTAQPGDLRYVDHDGNGVINEQDKTMIGNPNPKWTFGFSLQLNYKGFDLSMLTSGVAGNDIVQAYRNQSRSLPNHTDAILGRWHGPGTSNTIPRVTQDNSNWLNFSDIYIQKGDYLRINNLTLGYDFSRLLKINEISQLRLFVSGLNLHTFTRYDGMDPEIGYGPQNPSEDDNAASGVDLGYYPRPRTFMVGLNVKF